VLLSYYSKETILTLKQFYQRIAVFTIFTIACYILIITTGIPIIKVLYPTLAQSSLPYFYIANLATAIFLLGNTIQPILLRFCDSKWQLIIQGIYFCLYMIFGFIGMSKYGLLGFCYSLLTVNTLKIILMVFIVNYNLKKSSSKW
jgi:O-antigen/teichoic acid export membrane protein